MPKLSKSNILLSSASGKIGDIVIKQYKYGTVITKLPDMSKVKPTRAQKKKRNKFADAVAYAKTVIADPKLKAKMKKKAKKGSTVYHTAIKAFMKSNQKH